VSNKTLEEVYQELVGYKKPEGYSIYCDFDAEKHNQTYINYFEAVIDVTGKVMYGVPSHVAKLEQLACDKLKLDRDSLMRSCPRDKWLDYNDWLMEITGCIMVWTDFYLGKANKAQIDKLLELNKVGIYKGSLSPGYSL
jgi:hypothetical protein